MVSSGMTAPPHMALFELSDAASPSYEPLPNSSGFFALRLASA